MEFYDDDCVGELNRCHVDEKREKEDNNNIYLMIFSGMTMRIRLNACRTIFELAL